MRCGWCDASGQAGTHCGVCGGPLPAPDEADPGPEPPPAPREVPAAFARRLLWRNEGITVGAIFGAAGLLLTLPFAIVGLFVPPLLLGCLVSSWPLVLGSWMMWRGRSKALARLDVLRRGRLAHGKITSLQEGAAAGRRRVAYLYEVGGQRHAGVVETGEAGDLRVQAPVHVLVSPEAPERSELWPVRG